MMTVLHVRPYVSEELKREIADFHHAQEKRRGLYGLHPMTIATYVFLGSLVNPR